MNNKKNINIILCKNFNEMIVEKKFKRLKHFADKSEISYTTLWRCFTFKGNLTQINIKILANELGVNALWLDRGEGPKYIAKDNQAKLSLVYDRAREKTEYTLSSPHNDLINMAMSIFDSKTEYADILARNIQCFYEAIKKDKNKDKRLLNHEKRLAVLEKNLTKQIPGDIG